MPCCSHSVPGAPACRPLCSAFLFCLQIGLFLPSLGSLPNHHTIPQSQLHVYHTTMRNQLPKLAGSLRRLRACCSTWSPHNTSLTYKLSQAIEAFQKDPPTTVFLLSMRAGSVGINLTAASHVFLLEPCINPALEEQVQLLEGQGAYLVQVLPLAHPSMCLPGTPAGSAARVVVPTAAT